MFAFLNALNLFCSCLVCVYLRACVCSHAIDMTGAQDGSVRMFEWNRPQQLICFRQAGNARVTRLYFNSQGNKVRTDTQTHTERTCFVCLVWLCWLLCAPFIVWSCWWRGLPQSMAGQPDIIQPQTLPGEVTSFTSLAHTRAHSCTSSD